MLRSPEVGRNNPSARYWSTWLADSAGPSPEGHFSSLLHISSVHDADKEIASQRILAAKLHVIESVELRRVKSTGRYF